jgi:hypothetical protein
VVRGNVKMSHGKLLLEQGKLGGCDEVDNWVCVFRTSDMKCFKNFGVILPIGRPARKWDNNTDES